jgi:EAL domain-containing protein (putative c-di-GMP-specific phosphodiesterase class I)
VSDNRLRARRLSLPRQHGAGLIYLAHKLKMRACAEGVEDESTLRLLEGMRCDKVQGHYIGAASRAKDLERIVDDWNTRLPTQSQSASAG